MTVYSNLLEIIFDQQERQCSTELPSGNDFGFPRIEKGPALDAALVRLDEEFKAYTSRFKGGR